MLNHTKGGSHTSDKMVANSKYKVYSSEREDHSELAKMKHNLGLTNIKHNSFDIKIINKSEKPDFDGLDLREYGWKRTYALTPQQKKALEKNPNYVDFKEIMKYEGPQGSAVLDLNYKTDDHNIEITYIDDPESKPKTIEILKSMFERELGCSLSDKVKKRKSSDLINKLESN